MVSKGKILGRSALLFVTVGSTGFQFERLFSSLDQALIKIGKKTFLVAQVGISQYRFQYKNIAVYNYLSPAKIIYFFKKADKIISHAGPASIYLAVKYAKHIPLILPRRSKFDEHVDNHQLYFTNFLRKQLPKKQQKYFVINSEIETHIYNYLKEEPKINTLNKYIFKSSGRKKIIQQLEQFIESPNQ